MRATGVPSAKYPAALPIKEYETEDEAQYALATVGRQLWDGEFVWSAPLPGYPREHGSEWPAGEVRAIFAAEKVLDGLKRRVRS